MLTGWRKAGLVTGYTLLLCAILCLPIHAADTVSLSFENAEYTHIFRILAESAGLNVLIDPSVSGRGSFSLQGVSIGEALDLISEVSGMGYRVRGSTLIVAAKARLKEMESSTVRFLQVSHLSPETVKSALSVVMDVEDIYIQSETGLVVLQGPESTLKAAEEILNHLDRPGRATIDTEDQSLLDVLLVLSEELQLNLIADPSLAGQRIVLNRREVDPWELLRILESMAGIEVSIDGGTLIANGIKQPSAPPMQDKPKERIKVYRLDYAEPDVVFSALTMILSEEQIRSHSEGKTVMVRALPEQLAEADLLVEELDEPLPQVLLEVWVQEMSADALKNMGIDWKGLPSLAGDRDTPTVIELTWEPWELVMALRALEDAGQAKLLANPKIATLNGKEASIFVGDRVPITLTNKDGETYLEFLESGINLKVIPRVSEDEYITIQVRPEVSTFIWRGENQHPQIRTREAETEVRVKNGQPIIIGGLLQEQENELITKIPIISELPILGRLFRWQETKTLQTEMTIFLIPHIVSDDEGVMNQSFFTPAQ